MQFKSAADIFVSQNAVFRGDDTSNEIFEHLRDILALPSNNHAPGVEGYDCLAERFRIDFSDAERVWNSLSATEREEVSSNSLPPAVPCFIECGNVIFVISMFKRKLRLFGMRQQRNGFIAPFFMWDYVPEIGDDGSVTAISVQAEPPAPYEDVRKFIGKANAILGLITDVRFATCRKMLHVGNTSAQKAIARRLAQMGKPLFSYNLVTLTLPKTSIIRSETRGVVSPFCTRRHSVHGHWRLIDRIAEPYWRWIDEYKRGQKELGYVLKTTLIRIERRVAKGYLSPNRSGLPGERVKAIKSQ